MSRNNKGGSAREGVPNTGAAAAEGPKAGMPHKKALLSLITALALVLLLLYSFFYLGKNPPANQITPGTAAYASSNVVFGVASSGNASAIRYAISNGLDYFRTDITNTPAQESLMANVSAEGGHYLGILDYQTLGANPGPSGCASNCNWTLSTWNASVEAALANYPEVHSWEIWNEPQISAYQGGFLNSTYNYFLMLKSAYRIIKAHNQSDTVVCLGGDNIYTGGPSPSYYDYLWAAQVWSYGASSYCNAISLHAYTSFTYLMSDMPPGSNQTMGELFSEALSAYENLTGKPIWITEVGIPSNNGAGVPIMLNDSEARQALFLQQAYSLFLSKPYVRAVFWFNLEGYVHPPYEIDFGLLNATTLAPKSSFEMLLKFIRGQ